MESNNIGLIFGEFINRPDISSSFFFLYFRTVYERSVFFDFLLQNLPPQSIKLLETRGRGFIGQRKKGIKRYDLVKDYKLYYSKYCFGLKCLVLDWRLKDYFYGNLVSWLESNKIEIILVEQDCSRAPICYLSLESIWRVKDLN